MSFRVSEWIVLGSVRRGAISCVVLRLVPAHRAKNLRHTGTFREPVCPRGFAAVGIRGQRAWPRQRISGEAAHRTNGVCPDGVDPPARAATIGPSSDVSASRPPLCQTPESYAVWRIRTALRERRIVGTDETSRSLSDARLIDCADGRTALFGSCSSNSNGYYPQRTGKTASFSPPARYHRPRPTGS